MNKVTRVSVCMAVYNGEPYIKEQIQSVISELQDDDELLIRDDCSTDLTAKVIAEFEQDKRVIFRKNAKKLGIVKNFESTIQEAKGKYIFLCDQDDVWLPGKVESCVAELQKHLLIVTDCKVVDQHLNVLYPSFFDLRRSGKGFVKNIWKNSYLGCCMAFDRELLSVCLPIPANIPMHDMWLGLLAEANGSVLFMSKKFSFYRRHQSAASPTAGVSNLHILKQVKFRLVLIWYLVCRILQTKMNKSNKK